MWSEPAARRQHEIGTSSQQLYPSGRSLCVQTVQTCASYMEHAMRIVSHLLIWSLVTLGVLVPTLMLEPPGSLYATVLGDGAGTSVPDHVHAGVPFVVRDSYASQVCISSRSGRPLPPFVLPPTQFGVGSPASGTADVRAGVPFVVRDANGIQVCVSTRGGQSFPPFIAP
jgi:hypothetical protein